MVRQAKQIEITHQDVSVVREQRDALRNKKRLTGAEKRQLAELEELLSVTRKAYRLSLALSA